MRKCDAARRLGGSRERGMLKPDEAARMLRLRELGWGTRRIARELGCGRNTVRRYLEAGGWAPYGRARRAGKLAGLDDWLRERFHRHRGNAEVVRQELLEELGVEASLRTVERAVAPHRRLLAAEAKATLRFETPPGRQLQVDFGEARVRIGGELSKAHLFVATLGYSRRGWADAFANQRQSSWFAGMEGAFRHFGGVPEEVLVDNAKPLVSRHDAATREVEFNERFLAFAAHWGVRPRACAPFRARTKGKDERGVRYVKGNAIAGREFDSLEALRAHLARWQREVADVRLHGTTGETPLARFEREAGHLRPRPGLPPFGQLRDLVRTVQADCTVLLDTNAYSVPWRLIGERVRVVASGGRVRVQRGADVVAEHAEHAGRRARIVDRGHLAGVNAGPRREDGERRAEPAMLRPLDEYAAVAGGRF